MFPTSSSGKEWLKQKIRFCFLLLPDQIPLKGGTKRVKKRHIMLSRLTFKSTSARCFICISLSLDLDLFDKALMALTPALFMEDSDWLAFPTGQLPLDVTTVIIPIRGKSLEYSATCGKLKTKKKI